MNFKEIKYYIFHPADAARAKLRQIVVAAEWEMPPAGSTIEEFPGLPVSEAAALIHTARQFDTGGGGVLLEDWSVEDQKRMLRGEKPKGVPIHRNL